jgi:hypothetical protein
MRFAYPTGTKVTNEQAAQVKTLEGAIMPDGMARNERCWPSDSARRWSHREQGERTDPQRAYHRKKS